MRCKMKKKILFILALVFFMVPKTSHAVSQELEEKIIAIDTNKQKESLARARKHLNDKGVSQKKACEAREIN